MQTLRAQVAMLGSLLAGSLCAGSLEPPAGPTDVSSGMYSTEAICDRLESGAAGSTGAFTEPDAGPASTGCSLNDVMDKAPVVDDTDGAAAGDVLQGKTFWGLRSDGWGKLTGTMGASAPAPVPRTGQTDSYATGDDGDLKKGVAWPDPRFTDNGDGSVTDNLTGLVWLGDPYCANDYSDWSTALDWVAELNTSGTMNTENCGDTSNDGSHQTDWRLPNVRELHSLVDFGVSAPPYLPPDQPFGDFVTTDPDGIQQSYWSSTTHESGTTTQAWYLFLTNGSVLIQAKAITSGFTAVWPVRDGDE